MFYKNVIHHIIHMINQIYEKWKYNDWNYHIYTTYMSKRFYYVKNVDDKLSNIFY